MNDKKAQLIETDQLKPWSKNPRNNKHAIEKIAASIKRFGFCSPIIARQQDNQIIAGHTRWYAAKSIGLERVPVRFVELTEEQAIALNLADNRLAEIATWNDELLAEILDDLNKNLDMDLESLGFSQSELDMYLETDAEYMDTAAQAPHDDDDDDDIQFASTPGEYYKLGRHELYCGRYEDHADTRADILFWDPPWNEDLTPPIQNYSQKLVFTDSNNFGSALECFGNAVSYVFTWDCMNTHYVSDSRPLKRAKHCIVFGSMEDYTSTGYLLPKKADQPKRTTKNKHGTYRYVANNDGTTLADIYSQSISQLHTTGEHPHQKPLPWITAILANCCCGTVFDATAGSGTSLLAADKAGLTWKGAEIEPAYCDVIRKRWTQYAIKHNLEIGDGIQ